MSILAVITARKGSKRLPGKNLRILGAKPLINWTIDLAKEVSKISEILVSTDSEEIADIAIGEGALVPWIRPDSLARDDSDSIDVVLHALNWYERNCERVDGVLLLQPTSPFRSRKSIEAGIKLFEKDVTRPVVAVTSCDSSNSIIFERRGNYLNVVKFTDSVDYSPKEQEYLYRPNGSMYLASPDYLEKEKSFFKGDIQPLFIDSSFENIDIDDEEDWRLAENCLAEIIKNEVPRP